MHECQGSLGSLGGIHHQRATLGGTAYIMCNRKPTPTQIRVGLCGGGGVSIIYLASCLRSDFLYFQAEIRADFSLRVLWPP